MYSEVTRTCRAKKVYQYNFSEALHILHISSCINLYQTEFASANLPIICYLQSTVTSKFTEYLLLTVDCHQQIYQIFAIDSRLSPATP